MATKKPAKKKKASEKPGYDLAIKQLQELQKNGRGFVLYGDKLALHYHHVSPIDLANLIYSILEDHPVVGTILGLYAASLFETGDKP